MISVLELWTSFDEKLFRFKYHGKQRTRTSRFINMLSRETNCVEPNRIPHLTISNSANTALETFPMIEQRLQISSCGVKHWYRIHLTSQENTSVPFSRGLKRITHFVLAHIIGSMQELSDNHGPGSATECAKRRKSQLNIACDLECNVHSLSGSSIAIWHTNHGFFWNLTYKSLPTALHWRVK